MNTDNTYFAAADFIEELSLAMRNAADVYERMVRSGMEKNRLAKLEFTFVSDEKAKVERLRDFMRAHYPYSIERIEQEDEAWALTGETDEFPITVDNLMYWTLDMCDRGYAFDARLEAYGALLNPADQRIALIDVTQEEELFSRAMKQYQAGNRSGALMSWSRVVEINPANANALFSRAVVKDELHAWKAAVRDYDSALEIAPDFLDALNNRGSAKDNGGDHLGAIADYDKVIALGADDAMQTGIAYFNRGNAKLNLHDKTGACADWKLALALGIDIAQARIDEHCGR